MRADSVFLLCAAQPGDSHTNSVRHTSAFRRAAFRQRVMFSFAHPINSSKKRPSDTRCIISPCTHSSIGRGVNMAGITAITIYCRR